MDALKGNELLEEKDEELERQDLPTFTHDTMIPAIINMNHSEDAQNINFEYLPTYTEYLSGKASTGALLKLYFKNFRVEKMYDHVRFHHSDQKFHDDQQRLIEAWQTVRHAEKDEELQDHIKRIDEFSTLLNSLYSRMHG